MIRARTPPIPGLPEQRLLAALERLLAGSMGGEPRLAASEGRPLAHALGVLLAYLLVWGAVEAVTSATGMKSYKEVVSVLAWFAGLTAARALISRSTTTRLTKTIEHDILPYASPRFVEAVAADLERRNSVAQRIAWPLLAALVCAAAGAAAFSYDFEEGVATVLRSPEIWFGLFMMNLGFFISARSVAASGFYISFAEQLEEEPNDAFFVLAAADSPLIQGLAKLGSQVLVFWALIFLAILSSVLLALPWPGGYGLEADSGFLIFFVPIAGFVTLGIGSLVYLRSEAKIRSALRRFIEGQAAVLQQRMNTLLDPLAGRIPADSAELARLTAWHDRIVAGGRYGSRIGTAVSIALPFLLPAISFISWVIERLSQGGTNAAGS